MSIRIIAYDGEKSTGVKLGFPVAGELPGTVEDYCKDIIVRWGQSSAYRNRYGLREEFQKVLNPRTAIRANCMKWDAIQTFAKVVKTPHLFTGSVPAGKLAVVRPFEHTAGEGFEIREGPFRVPYGCYAIEFVDVSKEPDREVRVWFAGSHTLIGKRARSSNTDPRPCRSNWGYEFRTDSVTERTHWFDPRLATDTLKAAKAIGLEVGAADVLYKDGECLFLELNSAPSIDHHRLVEWFKKYIPLAGEEKFGYC